MKFILLASCVSILAVSSFAFGDEVTLKLTGISVHGEPAQPPGKDIFMKISADSATATYTVSEMDSATSTAPISVELTYQFTIGQLSSNYHYVRNPEINQIVYHSILGEQSNGKVVIRDTSVQLNTGEKFPDAAFSQLDVTEIWKDPKTQKIQATSTSYTDRGVYGIAYYSQQ
jgi:hypothetical protein